MKLAIWPFYSQQDKRTGKHLPTCGNVKQMAELARRAEAEGWDVRVAIPNSYQHDGTMPFELKRSWPMDIPTNNAEQRVHWDTRMLRSFFDGVHIALCNHEYLAVPVRTLFPKLKIVQTCPVTPEPLRMFQAAWGSADLVVCHGAHAASVVQEFTPAKVTYWPFHFDADIAEPRSDWRDVHALFVLRCSESNYTHHREFIQATSKLLNVSVAFTDVTSWLEKNRNTELVYWEPSNALYFSTPSTYIDTMHRSKVVVALKDDMFGGMALREAIACGCFPVLLDAPCYRKAFPEANFCTLDPSSIEYAIRDALNNYGTDLQKKRLRRLRAAALSDSYQAGWIKVREDLCSLL